MDALLKMLEGEVLAVISKAPFSASHFKRLLSMSDTFKPVIVRRIGAKTVFEKRKAAEDFNHIFMEVRNNICGGIFICTKKADPVAVDRIWPERTR